jgi:hypothetical protein
MADVHRMVKEVLAFRDNVPGHPQEKAIGKNADFENVGRFRLQLITLKA